MAWVKLDDDFFSNPKVMRAGRDARDLYLAALCFCNRGLTDGHIPQEALRRLAADADIDNVRDAAERLIAVGLWDACEGGYQIHDYLEYQPSRERVVATREVRAEAGSRGGKQRAANEQANPKQIATENQANSQALASENLKQNPTPSQSRTRPVPVHQPEAEPESVSLAPSREPYTWEFEEFWKTYPRTNGTKLEAFAAWKTLKAEERGPALAGLPKWKESHHWAVEGKIVYAERYLKRRMWKDDPAPPPEPRVRLLTSPTQNDEAMVAWMQLVREVANPGSEFPDRRLPRRIYDAAMAVGGPKAIDPAKPFQCKTFCDAYRAWTEVAS